MAGRYARGRFYAEFDPKTPATAQGQLVFFAQFLHSAGLYKRLQEAFPLEYVGNRGSGKVNVLGTAILGILNGHWRYSHINSVRGDTVNGALLGVENLVSEDVIRAAMKRVDETACLKVLLKEQIHSIYPMLGMPWILDVDTTVKSLYGKQEESDVGYNPHKPGRPSHAYHSYFVANIRLCLGVDVLNGKKSASKHGMDGLRKFSMHYRQRIGRHSFGVIADMGTMQSWMNLRGRDAVYFQTSKRPEGQGSDCEEFLGRSFLGENSRWMGGNGK